MKKSLSVLLCVCIAFAAVCPALAAKRTTFTLMVYLCGTDLESDGGMATRDLGEMVRSGLPKDGNVNVYVQTGGTKEWQARGLSNREGERWELCEEGLLLTDSLGRVNMGDEAVFADFLAYGFEHYPADRYGLILWDHGGGATGGVCYDELEQDCLFFPEIYNALASVTQGSKEKPFAFIGFDACLMASYELANHLEPFAQYMVASEELEPGTGWSYDGWLPMLAEDPGVSMEKLGSAIVDSYIEASRAENSAEYATLSVTDLSKLEPLRAAVETLAQALEEEIDGGKIAAISRLRQNMRSFGEMFDSASDMVDLTTFAEVYARYDETSARAIKDALADAVVYSRHTNNLSGVTGLSILVPFSTRDQAFSYMPYYAQVNKSPQYTKFVQSMLDGVTSGTGMFSFGTPNISQQSIQSAEIDWFSQYANDAEAYSSGAGELWGSLYGTDMEEDNESDFSLDSFLNTLFGGDTETCGFDAGYDDSQASLWGNQEDYSDTSFATNSGFGSGSLGALWAQGASDAAEEPAQGETTGWLWGEPSGASASQEVTVATDSGEIMLQNPFADTESEYAYTVQLTKEQLDVLGTVEANLMMDVSDPDFECYVELGYVQDVVMDWNRGKIYGMFDGTWATLDGQMVCMYDQIANERYIRSLIPIRLNGDDCYLLVVFDEEHPYGLVSGVTEGYTEAGLPARGMEKLREGDVVIPMYELLYWDEDGEQQSEPFAGDEIVVGRDETVPFTFSEVEGDADYCYGFCLTDIYGNYEYTDFVTLSF